MKTRIIIAALCAISLTSCGALSKVSLNQEALASAAVKTITATTITDDEIIQLSQQSVAYMDSTNTVSESGKYYDRLTRIAKEIKAPEGLSLNFKVYITDEVNAFACGDGSIRVYSGLMDTMDDDMLIAIIGHEIGHVVHKDSKAAMKRAYISSAARDAVTSVGGVVATLSQSILGDLAEAYVSAQYSQKQEFAADEYGFRFAVDNNRDKYSMYKALNKLVELSGGATTSSKVQKWFASHPDSGERAAKVKAMADSL